MGEGGARWNPAEMGEDLGPPPSGGGGGEGGSTVEGYGLCSRRVWGVQNSVQFS